MPINGRTSANKTGCTADLSRCTQNRKILPRILCSRCRQLSKHPGSHGAQIDSQTSQVAVVPPLQHKSLSITGPSILVISLICGVNRQAASFGVHGNKRCNSKSGTFQVCPDEVHITRRIEQE